MVRKPTEDYERIRRFIQNKEGKQFLLSDIFQATGISQDVIGAFLLRNFRRGLLKREKKEGCLLYKQRENTSIPLRKSKGAVAQPVWTVLVAEFPMYNTLQQLAVLASSATKTEITREHARVVVLRWLKNGFVEQERNRPLYRKKKDVTERPPAVW